jgi:hypothetical protein
MTRMTRFVRWESRRAVQQRDQQEKAEQAQICLIAANAGKFTVENLAEN